MQGRTIPKTLVKSRPFGQWFKKVLCDIGATIGVACIPIVIFDTIGHPASIVGSSMEPTLQGSDTRWWQRDIVWLSRIGLHRPQIGQIFTFISPDDPQKQHIKRLVVYEGDIVRPRRGSSYVLIPEGACWMESDNPHNSKDSNIYGPVSLGLLTGRATRILWPPSRWQTLETKVLETSSRKLNYPSFPFVAGFPMILGDDFDDDNGTD